MRAFACPVCHDFVAFETHECASCGTGVGIHLPTKSMAAVVDGAATIDGQHWIRCTQHVPLGCNWLAPAEQTEFERGRCLADSLIRREPEAEADDTLAREKLVPTADTLRRMVYQLDDYREALRVKLGEPYRTMLGHFRHEVGHYYQDMLVETGSGATKYLDECCALFDDERSSHSDATARHYRTGAPADWGDSFIS